MSPQSRPPTFALHVLLSASLAFAAAADAPQLPDGAVPVRSLEDLADTTLTVADSSARDASQAARPAPSDSVAPGDAQSHSDPSGSLRSDSVRSAPDSEPLPAEGRSANLPTAGPAWEKGIVLSGETGKPVPKAMVMLIGANDRYSAQSDAEGLYRLADVKPGAYTLKVGRKGYALYERESQAFAPGGNPVREIRLERNVPKGQLIEAKGGTGAGSAAGMMAARRKSAGVMEGVGAEQIAKSTDADAGAVARRITGTSLVGGKYIYVRGLGERYTNMTLNGLPVPSPEKDKRVVPQDLFPAWALESFAIRKTFTADNYADFAGGSVALETKGIPEKPFFKVTLGLGGVDYQGDDRFLNYGQKRLAYDGGDDYFGIDDGTRGLPKDFPTTILQVEDSAEIAKYKSEGFGAYTRKERLDLALRLTDIYAVDSAPIRPAQNFSLAFGDVSHPSEDARAGFLVSAGFKNKYLARDIHKQITVTQAATYDSTYVHPILRRPIVYHVQVFDTLPGYTGAGDREHVVALQKLGVGQDAYISQGLYEATLSGLADFGYESRDHRLFWKNFAVNIGSDTTNLGHWKQLSGGRQDNPFEDRYLLQFNQRSLVASQLGGGHYIGKGLLDSLTWATAYYRTTGSTPDSRQYYYIGNTDTVPLTTYQNNDIWGTRIWEKLQEDSWAARLDGMLVTPPSWTRGDTVWQDGRILSRLALPTGQSGLFATTRGRSFSAARYQYGGTQLKEEGQTLEEIRAPERLRQVMSGPGAYDFYTAPKSYDEYQAAVRSLGGYLSGGFGIAFLGIPLGFDAGMRWERYHLRLTAPFTGQQYGINRKLREDSTRVVETDEDNLYPMLSASMEPWRDIKLRILYSRTVLFPEFREIAPYSYNDYTQDRTVTGNPALRPTRVRNLDLRWDWYLPNRQILSFSLFRKDFTDPVEPIADNNHTQQFQNALRGYVRGAEMEAVLDLATAPFGLGPWLKGWTAGGNVAVMSSGVRLDEGFDSAGISKTLQVTNLHRPMVGQSPYLINAQIGEEGERGGFAWNQGLAYNVFGPRIKTVGIQGVPDEYEQPFHSLDYLGQLTFVKRHQFTVKIKNILNSAKRVTRTEDNDTRTYYTVPKTVLDRLYAGIPREYVTESVREGTGYELAYSLSF